MSDEHRLSTVDGMGAGAPAADADTSAAPANPYATIADNAFTGSPESRRDLIQRILDDPRMHDHKEGFLSCIQCGVCTSGCPAARFTEY